MPVKLSHVAAWVALCTLCACTLSCGKNDEETPPVTSESSLQIVTLSPAADATNVPLDTPLTITFSQAIDPERSADLVLRLNPAVEGTRSFDEQGKTLRFTPAQGWSKSTRYKVTLEAAQLFGKSGEKLDMDRSWEFSTSATVPSQSRGVYKAESGDEMRVEVTSAGALRTYTLTTTAALRDDTPADKRVVLTEQPDQPRLRSSSSVFDALFTLAVEEARQNAVSSISDGAFNNGQGVPCECFETGANWKYVWTRDTAYAVDLGLAILDPSRARRSLEFKLSSLKSGGSPQIVQDTGSGGSWPVSTDRVIWAQGAWALLPYLEGEERAAFAAKAHEAIANTIEQDRAMIFDARDGLYRGEQSFLDWREQSYPSWTAQDTVHLAMSKTLSTNVAHLRILQVGAALARELGDTAQAARYGEWAEALRAAINEGFWLEDASLYSAMKLGELDPSVLHKYDLLGESLAVLHDVADPARAARVVSAYPHVPMGPAVLWPQQPLIPIYHNRGIWPFVTAYGLLAARQVDNPAVFELDLESLVRGAALNLSNMENFEFTALVPWYEDGPYSGPVVNSRRQLWSVAGYFGAIVKGVFGFEASEQGVRIAPYVTGAMHERWFEAGERVTLEQLSWRGHTLRITLALPEMIDASAGAYRVASISLNGAPISPEQPMSQAMLTEQNEVEVVLEAASGADVGAVSLVEDLSDFKRLWAPREPNLSEVALREDRLEVRFDGGGEEGVRFNVFRDGVEVASDLPEGSWRDEGSGQWRARTHCYTVEAVFPSSGNRSHHARPLCYWGEPGADRIEGAQIYAMRAVGGSWSTMHGRPHYQDWGGAEDELVLEGWRPKRSGEYLMQLVYGNGAGGFNTGITAAVKRVRLEDALSGELLSEATVVMPQLGSWDRWGESSLVPLSVSAERVYRVRIVDGINMSYFAHFEPYTGGTGGGAERFNRANVTALKLLPMEGELAPGREPRLTFDGSEDLGAYAPTQLVTPGAPLAAWSQWGLDWDEEALYVTLVTPGFEAPYEPMMIYLEVAGEGEAFAAATPGRGAEYSGQTAQLPFSPTHMISLRRNSDDAAGAPPWNGVYVPRAGEASWQRHYGLTPGEQWWVSGDMHTISARVPLSALGTPGKIRLVGHFMHETVGEEWKELLPETHTPWRGGGGYLEIDLSGAHERGAWQNR